MLDYETKVVGVVNVREAIIKIVGNQERLRLRIEAAMEEVEKLKDIVNKACGTDNR